MAIEKAEKERIIRALQALDVPLPQGAVLFSERGRTSVFIRDPHRAMRARMQLKTISFAPQCPPGKMIEPWDLPGEPYTDLRTGLNAVPGVTRAGVEYGASLEVLVATVYCRKGERTPQLETAVRDVLRSVERATPGLTLYLNLHER